jgi:hypothetical protein
MEQNIIGKIRDCESVRERIEHLVASVRGRRRTAWSEERAQEIHSISCRLEDVEAAWERDEPFGQRYYESQVWFFNDRKVGSYSVYGVDASLAVRYLDGRTMRPLAEYERRLEGAYTRCMTVASRKFRCPQMDIHGYLYAGSSRKL